MQLIDLTHVIEHNMPVYPGDTKPALEQTSFLDKSGVVHFSFHSGMHTGTHIDAPSHFLEQGQDVSQISVHNFFGRGRLIDARGELTVHEGLLDQVDLQAHDIVLVLTGLSKQFNSPTYFQNFPEVTEGFAQKLIDKKVSMLGLDTCSPDREPYEVHKLLLQNQICIIENLTNLDQLLGQQFNVIALPINIKAEAGLARVVAGVEI